MSQTLYYRPRLALGTPFKRALPDALKIVLKRRLQSGARVYGLDFVLYLEGLTDVGVEGAKELMVALVTHDAVELWLE